MPFTPYHMGPGLLIKAALRGGFSLMIFGWTQIVTDIEPLVAILRGTGELHGFSHTYLGAVFIGLFSAASGKYLSEFFLRLIDASFTKGVRIPWWVAILSGFIGSFSHVALDSIMHADVTPFAPISPANPMLRLISVRALHDLCIFSGIIGTVLFALTSWVAFHQSMPHPSSRERH